VRPLLVEAALRRKRIEQRFVKQLDAAITAAPAHINDQANANRVLAGQMASQTAISKELITKHMQPITKFARAKLRGLPEVTALTSPGRSGSPKPLLRAARSMATAAAPYQAQLTEAGFPADTVAQLTAAADSLDAVLAQRAQAKGDRVGSTKGIHESLIVGRDAVKLLGAAIHRQFSHDASLLAIWRSASRVTANPVRTTTATVPAPTVAAVAPSVPAVTTVAPTVAAVTPSAPAVTTVAPTAPAASSVPASAGAPAGLAAPAVHV